MTPSFSKPLIWCGISPPLFLLLLLRRFLLLHLCGLHSAWRKEEKIQKGKRKKKKKTRQKNDKNEHTDECQWVDSERLRGKKQTQIYINISTWRRKNQYSNDWELQEWKAELCEWWSECFCEWHFEGSDIWSFEWRGAGSKHTHITFNELRDLYSFTHRAAKQKYTHTNTANTQLSSFSP